MCDDQADHSWGLAQDRLTTPGNVSRSSQVGFGQVASQIEGLPWHTKRSFGKRLMLILLLSSLGMFNNPWSLDLTRSGTLAAQVDSAATGEGGIPSVCYGLMSGTWADGPTKAHA